MFICFLHNTLGPWNCGITSLSANRHKPYEYWLLSRPQGLGRCDVLETLVSPYISPYVSRRSVQPGAFFTAQLTLPVLLYHGRSAYYRPSNYFWHPMLIVIQSFKFQKLCASMTYSIIRKVCSLTVIIGAGMPYGTAKGGDVQIN